MGAEDEEWMAYIDREVRSFCEAKGWGHQVRRKWSVREKPVEDSAIEDYEWKLIPSGGGELPDARDGDFEGVYYVLWFDRAKNKFVLQHDTSHGGVMGPHWEEATYTEISPNPFAHHASPSVEDAPAYIAEVLQWRPPAGWLNDHLRGLTARFAPNSYCLT